MLADTCRISVGGKWTDCAPLHPDERTSAKRMAMEALELCAGRSSGPGLGVLDWKDIPQAAKVV
jgi:hypothetical protein